MISGYHRAALGFTRKANAERDAPQAKFQAFLASENTE
jgi:hypothetical protein